MLCYESENEPFGREKGTNIESGLPLALALFCQIIRLIFYAIARCQCAIVGVEDAASHPVVVDLLEGLVADRALEDDALEGLALVARHQLHTDHLALTHRHVAEHLESQGNFILPG